ncbi:hypothetical protein ACFSTD_05030 [Novosphingobium colocasiae]
MANTAPPQIAFEPVRVRALRRIVSSGVVRHKLTTLVAPIGYGKTTVMGMVLAELRRSGRHAAWVTLGPPRRYAGCHRPVAAGTTPARSPPAPTRPRRCWTAAPRPIRGSTR